MADEMGSTSTDKSSSDGLSPFAPPQIVPVKGGGAIRGMGEKFSANPVTGTGSLTVPIAVSPGRSGFGPQLSLSYRLWHWQWSLRYGLDPVFAGDHAQDR